jgi:hypothetical protein
MIAAATMTVSELEAECNRLQLRVLELKEQGRQTQVQLDANRSALAKLKRKAPTPRVSDHALLRYLERVKGVDVEAIKAEIMTPETIAAIKAGASAVNVNGCRMPIKDGCIATVLAKEQRLKRSTKKGFVMDLDADADEELEEALGQ